MRSSQGNARVVKRISSVLLTGLAYMAITGCTAQLAAPDAVPLAPVAESDPGVEAGPAGNKAASVAYHYYFNDPISDNSLQRWTIGNHSGTKAWHLSASAFSAPKAFVMGANYWHNENDTLTTEAILVPGYTSGLKLALRLKYKLQPGDILRIQYSQWAEGDDWETLAAFDGGQNAAYPDWSKVTYGLADNAGNGEAYYRVRFAFTSNGSGLDWGVGVDNVVIYQTALSAPVNLATTHGYDWIDLDWDAPADGTPPTGYIVERSISSYGAWAPVAELQGTATSYTDNSAEYNEIYVYRVRAVRSGFPDGPPSNTAYGEKTGH
jgi:hypothetical protein